MKQKQLPASSYSYLLSKFLRLYYLSLDHPFKLRILGWVEKIAGNKRMAIRTRAGFLFSIDRRDYIQKTVFEKRSWDAEIEKTLRESLKTSDVFYDIGANVGYFSLLALQLKCKYVVSFEPNPELFSILNHNLKNNRYNPQQYTLVDKGLGEAEATFLYHEGPIENSGIGRFEKHDNKDGILLSVISLDGFLAKTSAPRPTILKIDVEGWELKVLEGGKTLFYQFPPRLVIFEADCDSWGSIKDPDLLRFFKKRGYRIEHLERETPETKENFVAIRT